MASSSSGGESNVILDLINELNENVEMIKPKKKAFKKRLAAKLLISLNSMTDVSVAKSLIDVVRKINDVDQVIDSAAFTYLKKRSSCNSITPLIYEELRKGPSSKEKVEKILSLIQRKKAKKYKKDYLTEWLNLYQETLSKIDSSDSHLVAFLHKLSVIYSFETSASSEIASELVKYLKERDASEFRGVIPSIINAIKSSQSDFDGHLSLLRCFSSEEVNYEDILTHLLPLVASKEEYQHLCYLLLKVGVVSDELLALIEQNGLIRKLVGQLDDENLVIFLKTLSLISLSIDENDKRLKKQFNTNKVLKTVVEKDLQNLSNGAVKSVGYFFWSLLTHLPLYTTQSQLQKILSFAEMYKAGLKHLYFDLYSIFIQHSAHFDETFLKKPLQQANEAMKVAPNVSIVSFVHQAFLFNTKYRDEIEVDSILFMLENFEFEGAIIGWKLLMIYSMLPLDKVAKLHSTEIKKSIFKVRNIHILAEFLLRSSKQFKKELCKDMKIYFRLFVDATKTRIAQREYMHFLMAILVELAQNPTCLKQTVTFILLVLSLSNNLRLEAIGWKFLVDLSKPKGAFSSVGLSKDLKYSLSYRIFNVAKVKFDKKELRPLFYRLFLNLQLVELEPEKIVELIKNDEKIEKGKEEFVLTILDSIKDASLLKTLELSQRLNVDFYQQCSAELRDQLKQLIEKSSNQKKSVTNDNAISIQDDKNDGEKNEDDTSYLPYFSPWTWYGKIRTWIGANAA